MGNTYEFQWWYSLAHGCECHLQIATAGNSVLLDGNIHDSDGGLGQYAIGTFVADSPTQAISFRSPRSTNGALNGFQLRNVSPPIPEPASGLFGLALCGVMMLRRRPASDRL